MNLKKRKLEEFLSLNPAYRFDYKIFGYTRLSPDLSVTYRRKKELKKKAAHFPVRRLVWLIPAAAAIVLLICRHPVFHDSRKYNLIIR